MKSLNANLWKDDDAAVETIMRDICMVTMCGGTSCGCTTFDRCVENPLPTYPIY